MAGGLIHTKSGKGLTWLLQNELQRLHFGVLKLEPGENYCFDTENEEYGLVLISGFFSCEISQKKECLGIRTDPFHEKPCGVMISPHEHVNLIALKPSLIGVGKAAADKPFASVFIHPSETKTVVRGTANWQREVRYCLWHDNTYGNQLMMGETVIPAGNWSTFPPHKHDQLIAGQETPYDEAFYFLFPKQSGFGFAWQYNAAHSEDRIYRFQNGDLFYMDSGYHSLVCGPLCAAYQLTIMAGPCRKSQASIDPFYQDMLSENGMSNPYQHQTTRKI